MRILYVSQEYPPLTLGGIGGYARSVATRMAQRGHDVHVLSCVTGQPDTDEVVDGVTVHRRGTGPALLGRIAATSATLSRVTTAAAVRQHLRRLQLAPDVVEAPDYMAESLLLPQGLPLVVMLHSPIGLVTRESGATLGPDGRVADRLESLAARRADVVMCPSKLLADDLAASGWTGGVPVSVVPYPMDHEAFPVPAVRSTPPRILAVGRIEERKGALVLLEAAAILRQTVPELEVVLVGRPGPGPEGQLYLRQVRERAAELGEWARLVDGVPRDELPQWYGGARVIALASRFDNYPMTALEAMSCARPVVATTTTGQAPLVAQVDSGAVVPPDDPTSLAEALRPYIEDSDFADDAGARSRELILAQNEQAVTGREAGYRRAMAQTVAGQPAARAGRSRRTAR